MQKRVMDHYFGYKLFEIHDPKGEAGMVIGSPQPPPLRVMNLETVVLVCVRHQTFSTEEKYFDYFRQIGVKPESGIKHIKVIGKKKFGAPYLSVP